jgi:hypothetical protein
MTVLPDTRHDPPTSQHGLRVDEPGTLRPPIPAIPESTALAALATRGQDDPYLTVGDHLELLLTGLEPGEGAEDAREWASLALLTLFQFVERLSDVAAILAVRTRIDWKYALRLPIDYAGLPAPDLAPFRATLAADRRSHAAFARLLRRVGALDTPWSEGIPAAPEVVLAAIRNLNRAPLVYRTMARAVEAVAEDEPAWYRSSLPVAWTHRYQSWKSGEHLCLELDELEQRITAIGRDGFTLLERVAREDAPATLAELPEVELLRRVWWWQYDKLDGLVTLRLE